MLSGERQQWAAHQMGHSDWGMIRKVYGRGYRTMMRQAVRRSWPLDHKGHWEIRVFEKPKDWESPNLSRRAVIGAVRLQAGPLDHDRHCVPGWPWRWLFDYDTGPFGRPAGGSAT